MSTFRLMRLMCQVALVLGLGTAAASAADEWAMRWRVYNDVTGGVTFRYPYAYTTPDQYKGELFRRSAQPAADSVSEEVKVIEIDGKLVRVRLAGMEGPRSGPDVRAFSLTSQQVTELGGGELGATGDAVAKQKFTWKEFDYYSESPTRPFASRKWAPKEITAMIGESAKGCALVVKHGDRQSGLILAGGLSTAENQAIIDTFEILQPGKGKLVAMNWRDAQGRAGKVFDNDGKAITSSGKSKSATWLQGWDMETQHYHVTSHVSPTRLQQYGQYLEALYKAYSEIYEPEQTPPYKLEVHVFNTQQDFMAASAAYDFPVGQTVGGFFAFTLPSIFVYEESSKWGGDSFSVEHVMAHECSHQFLHMACNGSRHVPTWINEGLAVYFENGVVQGGKFTIRPPRDRVEDLKQYYDQRKTTLIPVEQYLAHFGHIAPAQYGEVYAMTNFWLFGTCKDGCRHRPGECGLAHFRDYWKRLKGGEDGTKAFDETFMEGMIKAKGSREAAIAAWQQAYFDYVKRVLR